MNTCFGPVNMSGHLLSLVAYVGYSKQRGEDTVGVLVDFLEGKSLSDLNKALKGYDNWPIGDSDLAALRTEVGLLVQEWGRDYPLDILYEANGTGVKTHMLAGELPINWKFEIDGVKGGAGTPKQWRRLENPFGPDIVDGQIAARVTNAYDKTEGKTEKIKADTVVRPCMGGADSPDNHIRGYLRTPAEIQASKNKEAAYRVAATNLAERTDTYIKQRFAEAGKPITATSCFYSAYPTDNDVPQDNLDEVAVEGPCIFVAGADDFWAENSKPFKSEVLNSPTWLELCYQFELCMKRTRDYHHVFLEGVHKTKKTINGVPVYEFSTGS